MLLTLSNLHALQKETVPHLTSQFETNFSVKLTEEFKTIQDVLGQINARLFQSYCRSSVERLSKLIQSGIMSPSWAPTTTRPSEARPYVYEALLHLVLVHTEVSTTSVSLLPHILSYMFDQTSLAFLEAFKQRQKYSLAELMQATLDMEFVAQTMNQFITPKAGEIQGQIYQLLDQRTDNEARTKLQDELSEMRGILKKLRDATRSEL